MVNFSHEKSPLAITAKVGIPGPQSTKTRDHCILFRNVGFLPVDE